MNANDRKRYYRALANVKIEYLLWNDARGEWSPGFRTSDRAHALRWLRGCQPFMRVVSPRPTSFGETIARGGDVCNGCGVLLSAHEKTTAGGDCFGCRVATRKVGAA